MGGDHAVIHSNVKSHNIIKRPLHCNKINTEGLKIFLENAAIPQFNPNVDEFTKEITSMIYVSASISTRESENEVVNPRLERWERLLEETNDARMRVKKEHNNNKKNMKRGKTG